MATSVQCIQSFLFILFSLFLSGVVEREVGSRQAGGYQKHMKNVPSFSILASATLFSSRCLSLLTLPPLISFYFYLTLSWRFVTIFVPWSEKRAPAANTSERFITQSLRVQVFFLLFLAFPSILSFSARFIYFSFLFFLFNFMNLFSGAALGGLLVTTAFLLLALRL